MKVTLVQGGGAGFDQVPAVRKILDAAGAKVEWDEHLAGLAAVQNGLPPIPDSLLESLKNTKLGLKTKLLAWETNPAANYNILFRRELGLFATVRPLKNLRGLTSRFQDVNILVIRELTEDLYAAIEHEIVPGVVQSIKVVTEAACRRFLEFAFRYASDQGRKKIHAVHKANILKLADGLFLEVFRETAKQFPKIEPREIIVDNCCMQMVSRPHQFDVMVMGNLYGDIVSDLGAGIVGGISATAGINFGQDVTVYETFHGGHRETIGENKANPWPLLLPAIDMLLAEGQSEPAKRAFEALQTVLAEGRIRTPDLGGTSTTTDMANAVIAAMPSE
ncbi:MAG: isocitrate/isopropylmalate family dehydrogenase [Gemmataceae bacterium]